MIILEDGTFRLEFEDGELPLALKSAKEPRVEVTGYKPLADVLKVKSIVALTIFPYPYKTFEPLTKLTKLRELTVMHLPAVRSLAALSKLKHLERLSLRTLPQPKAKQQKVDSLRPLAKLKKLVYLQMIGVYSADDDLSPLAGIKSLKELSLPNHYSQKQFAELAARLPQVPRTGALNPYREIEGMNCPECGEKMVMLTGGDFRVPVICRRCKPKPFQKAVAKYQAYYDAALPK